MHDRSRPPSGHVFRVDGVRGPVWFAKYRLPDGRQVQKRIGPGWSERGRPPAGHFTKRLAQAWLRDVLDEVRRGTLPGIVQSGVTFAEAAAEWLRFIEQDRERKPSTVRDYRSILEGSACLWPPPVAGGDRARLPSPRGLPGAIRPGAVRLRYVVASSSGDATRRRLISAREPAGWRCLRAGRR